MYVLLLLIVCNDFLILPKAKTNHGKISFLFTGASLFFQQSTTIIRTADPTSFRKQFNVLFLYMSSDIII